MRHLETLSTYAPISMQGPWQHNFARDVVACEVCGYEVPASLWVIMDNRKAELKEIVDAHRLLHALVCKIADIKQPSIERHSTNFYPFVEIR